MANGVYLTLLIGPTVPVPVPQPVIEALTEVEVTSSTDKNNGFKLSFTLNNRSPLHTFFLIAGGQTPLMRVIIILTINGMPNTLMDGVMTEQKVTSGSQPGQSILTIMGSDLSRVMELIDFSGLPYPAMSIEARVTFILGKYASLGIIPRIIPSPFPETPNPTEQIPTQKESDLAYINNLAESVGYVFYIEPGPIPGTNIAYWGPEIKVGIPQPALNFDMDAHTNVESLNFTFTGDKNKLPIVFIQNKLTRFPIPIPIPKISPLQPPLGLIPAPITNVVMLKETAKMTPMQALMRGMAEASTSADAVAGTGTLDVTRYGRLLKSRALVGVRGVGMAFDGLHFVKSVSTTIKSGEIKQSFELTRNGLISTVPGVLA